MANHFEIRSINGNYTLGAYDNAKIAATHFEEFKTAFATSEELLADGIELVELVPVRRDVVLPTVKKVDKS